MKYAEWLRRFADALDKAQEEWGVTQYICHVLYPESTGWDRRELRSKRIRQDVGLFQKSMSAGWCLR